MRVNALSIVCGIADERDILRSPQSTPDGSAYLAGSTIVRAGRTASGNESGPVRQSLLHFSRTIDSPGYSKHDESSHMLTSCALT